LLLAALGLAERRGSRVRRATAFEVLATDKNQQQNNKQGMDFHFPPLTQTINNQPTKPRGPLKHREAISVPPGRVLVIKHRVTAVMVFYFLTLTTRTPTATIRNIL
jgi:hypothetical protein